MHQKLIHNVDNIKRHHSAYLHSNYKGLLHPGEFAVLNCLNAQEYHDFGMQPSQVSDVLQLPRPAVTQILNRIEEKGYVIRNQGKVDRRVSFVQITPLGTKKLLESKKVNAKLLAELEGYMGEEDMVLLSQILERIDQFFQEKLKEMEEGK